MTTSTAPAICMREDVGYGKDLSVLIVNYNTRDLTLGCLRSLYEQTHPDMFEVILVDNASTDGSADAIAEAFPQVSLIRSERNLGFGRANNLAARMATGRLLLLLNPDTVVLDRAVDRLKMFAEGHPEAGIWGGRTLFPDGSLNPTSCWRFMSLWSLFTLATGLTALQRNNDILNREGYGGWSRDRVREVEVVTGCLLLISRKLWDQLEGFDESFFMYSEEIDLCYRARQLGARPLMTPSATIIHYDGACEQILSSKMTNLFLGKVSFMQKHWRGWKCSAGIRLLELLVLVRILKTTLLATWRPNSASRRAEVDGWRSLWLARDVWTRGYVPSGRHAK